MVVIICLRKFRIYSAIVGIDDLGFQQAIETIAHIECSRIPKPAGRFGRIIAVVVGIYGHAIIEARDRINVGFGNLVVAHYIALYDAG